MSIKINEIKTHEDYAVALMASIASLKTLRSWQKAAYDSGLLDMDETELATALAYECDSLAALYSKQMKYLLERVDFDEAYVLKRCKEEFIDG